MPYSKRLFVSSTLFDVSIIIFSSFVILSPLPEGVSARTFCTSEKVDSDADAKSVKAFEKSSIASFVSLMRVAVFAKPENCGNRVN